MNCNNIVIATVIESVEFNRHTVKGKERKEWQRRNFTGELVDSDEKPKQKTIQDKIGIVGSIALVKRGNICSGVFDEFCVLGTQFLSLTALYNRLCFLKTDIRFLRLIIVKL